MTTTAEWRKWNALNTKPITNADRIRSMTDEELARWLTKTQRIGDVEVFRDGYYQLWLDWLREEVTDG